ncbi:MAG: hypothetical protein ACXVCP_05000 [Bdellovibrio sp.]
MANNLRFSLFIIFASFILFQPVLALDNYKEYKRDRWDFEAATQFFYSEANYLTYGTSTQGLPNNNHYQLLDVTFATRYMPKPNWAMFGFVNVGNSESVDSIARRTNSSFNFAGVGFDFVMYSGAFQLIPEFILVMPFQHVDPASDTVLNSEGVLEFRSRMLVQRDYGTFLGYGWLGFNYRGDGRSFLMPYGVGLKFKYEAVHWGAEILGFQSVSSDTVSNNALRTGYINGVNAGSLKFYSKEPSLVDSQVYINFLLSKKWTLQANAGSTLAGENIAAGFHVGALLRYSFDMAEGYTPPEARAPIRSSVPNMRSELHDEQELSSEKKVNQFREDVNDGVDQQIFKAEPTKRPQPQIEERLDQTDFQVELKNKKKKRRSY